MKILRYRKDDAIKPGILDNDKKIRDASSLVKDWDAQNIAVDNLRKISGEDLSSLPIIELVDSIAPCVNRNARRHNQRMVSKTSSLHIRVSPLPTSTS